MANVYVEARPKGRPEGSHIDDYVVEDQADHALHTSKTQREAIEWAKKERHSPHTLTRTLTFFTNLILKRKSKHGSEFSHLCRTARPCSRPLSGVFLPRLLISGGAVSRTYGPLLIAEK